jgi:hypothetical protein
VIEIQAGDHTTKPQTGQTQVTGPATFGSGMDQIECLLKIGNTNSLWSKLALLWKIRTYVWFEKCYILLWLFGLLGLLCYGTLYNLAGLGTDFSGSHVAVWWTFASTILCVSGGHKIRWYHVRKIRFLEEMLERVFSSDKINWNWMRRDQLWLDLLWVNYLCLIKTLMQMFCIANSSNFNSTTLARVICKLLCKSWAKVWNFLHEKHPTSAQNKYSLRMVLKIMVYQVVILNNFSFVA